MCVQASTAPRSATIKGGQAPAERTNTGRAQAPAVAHLGRPGLHLGAHAADRVGADADGLKVGVVCVRVCVRVCVWCGVCVCVVCVCVWCVCVCVLRKKRSNDEIFF